MSYNIYLHIFYKKEEIKWSKYNKKNV